MFLAAFAASACGGGSSSTPSTPSPTTTASVTIAITAINGNKSFAPNPVQAGGLPVVFSNNDSTVHHIVMDDGSVDFGTINPGTSSSAKTIGAGGNYHCELHPSMVGSINGAVAPDPAPGSGNGY
jgi:plastocyanin